jgi:hypothetical protein
MGVWMGEGAAPSQAQANFTSLYSEGAGSLVLGLRNWQRGQALLSASNRLDGSPHSRAQHLAPPRRQWWRHADQRERRGGDAPRRDGLRTALSALPLCVLQVSGTQFRDYGDVRCRFASAAGLTYATVLSTELLQCRTPAYDVQMPLGRRELRLEVTLNGVDYTQSTTSSLFTFCAHRSATRRVARRRTHACRSSGVRATSTNARV